MRKNRILEDIANGLSNFFVGCDDSNDPIVQLFRVEYNKEYRMLKRAGVNINRALALEHMTNR